MSNINVRVVGTANVSQMSGAFGKLESQVTQLNAQLAQMVALQNGVDPTGYERMASAAANNSRVFRSAAASTGMFEVQQLKVNKATDDYIRKLQKQQLSFREMSKQRKIASAAYKEQLAMEQMVVRQNRTGTIHGKSMLDVAYPNEISRDLDTAANRLAFFNEQLKSGARQMVNWGKNTQWAGRQLMVGFTMPVAAFGAAAAVASYQVDKELTRIAKVYDMTHDAMSSDMKEVAAAEREASMVREASMDTAIKAARTYGAAGTDTLNVQAELAATGLKGAKLQEYTNEVMRISALGELDYADSIQSAISMQSVFNLSTRELTEAFNYMNAVENATSLQTKDFAAAIPIAAAPVKAFGGDIQELGVLLTAMKERGIEATQGANAIKAAMQRLGRPSKQIQEEWKALTGTDITKIFDQSEGLTDLFSRIREATRDLTDKEQIKAFAGLFGTYQVTRMSALVEGMDDLAAGTGQVSKAMELATADAGKLADVADREIGQQAESISGKWDRAFRELQLQMSTLGAPFLEVATVVVRGVSKLIEAFNGLPNAAKIGIATLIGIGAVAGPVIMLTGLFANLFGNAISGFATVGRWITKFTGGLQIATTEERAAAMAADLHSTALTKEASAAQMLTMQLNKLSLAQAAANRNARDARLAQLVDSGMPRSAAYAQLAAERRRDLQNAGLMNNAGESINVMGQTSADVANNSARASRNWRNLAVSAGTAAAAASIMFMSSEGAVGQIAEIVFYASLLGPILTPLAGLLVSGFKKATAQIALMNKSLKTTQALTVATSAAAASGGAARGANVAANATTAAAAASATAGRWGKVLAVVGTVFSRIWSAVKLISRAMGPVGWVIAGASGAWAIYKKITDSQKEAAEKQAALTRAQVEGAKAIANASKTYADETGKALSNLKTISTTSILPIPTTSQDELIKMYEGEGMKPYMDTFKAETTPANTGGDYENSGQYAMATQRFWELQVENGLSAKEAAANIRAMYIAAGSSAYEADTYAADLLKTIGNVDKASVGTKVDILRNFTNQVRSNGPEAMAELAPQLFYQFAHEFESAANGYDAQAFMTPLKEGIGLEWKEAFANLDTEYMDALASVGITTSEGFKEFMQSYAEGGDYGLYIMDEIGMKNMELRDKLVGDGSSFSEVFTGASANAVAFEKALVQTAVSTLHLKGEFKTLEDVFNDPIFKSKIEPVTDKTVNDFRERVKGMKDIMDAPLGMFGSDDTEDNRMMQRNRLLQEMTAKLKANGVETDKIRTLNQALVALQQLLNGKIGETGGKLRQAASAAQGMASIIRGAFNSLTGADFMTAAQAGMQGVQEDIADEYRENFDDRMNNALEARQNMWDNRAEALQNEMDRRADAMNAAHERQQEALDEKWEKRMEAAEKYWDRRIELVDKAIEHEQKAEDMRQRMFDAEIARINKLNEMANANIDFNVALNEGNFDEAAKIRNDRTAGQAQTALEQAAAAGSRRSERRINKMEKRKDRIDEAREQAMSELEAQAEAEREALAASQERQQEHLQKVTEMRQEALAQQTEDDMEAQREIWENRKESLEEQLELFLSFIAANEKQLKKHMDNVGLSYHKFGEKVLKPKGEEWSKFFGERMQFHIRKSGLQLASDKMWKKLGEGSTSEMLKGMGFKNMGEFRHFIQTGNFGGSKGKGNNPDDGMGGITRHEGGFVDSGSGSRKGVARTLRGLHPNERMVRAQDGEFVVNKRDAAKNREALEAINAGHGMNSRSNVGHGVGGEGGAVAPGVAALMASFLNKKMAVGTGIAMNDAYQKKKAQLRRARRSGGPFSAGQPGMYGDRYFGAQQLQHAATIASVGKSMGMSARDIMIGIMTAITESGLVNVNYGDRDSLGLFQQRPSMGWGTPAQVTNPKYASRAFFGPLKGHAERGSEPPWLAAQHIQRSAYADGSNYRQYWDEAQAIYKGLSRASGTAGGGYVSGSGGWHKPSVPGKGWSNSHDYGNGIGSPLYAVSDGVITTSKATTSGGTAGNGLYGDKYTSYGETIVMRTSSGDLFRYAHLNPGARYVNVGQKVKGGSLIGRSGNTGNSSGPHTHFDVNGVYNAREWLQGKGVGLRTGGYTISDGLARLHANEVVVDPIRTKRLFDGIDNFASGTGNQYTIQVDASGTNATADDIADKVIKKIERLESRKPKKRRN